MFGKDIKPAPAVKAIEDTMEYNGLVPSLLLVRVLPHFPGVYSRAPDQLECMNAMDLARWELESITVQLNLC